MVDHWALDELERVVGCETLASKRARADNGDWDSFDRLPTRTLRRLRGAGFMSVGGAAPDQLAELIRPRVAGIESTDQAMDWYVKTCLVALTERREIARRRRERSLMRRSGTSTYFEYRTGLAHHQGYKSYWHMRKARGWE